MDTLSRLRQAIDAIDREILRKLEERTAIVEQVGHYKSQQSDGKSFIRPGREAMMVRELVASAQGQFPKAAIALIWRLIISGSLSIEQAMHVTSYYSPGEEYCYWLAREYFGAFTPVGKSSDTIEILEAVERGDAAIGVLPMPWHDSENNQWWLTMRKTSLAVFARLPFIQTGEERYEAVAIANVKPEATGDDTSLLCIEIASNVTDSDVTQALHAEGFRVMKLTDVMEVQDVVLLAYVQGFYTLEDEAIQSLMRYKNIQDITILGAFANPMIVG